MSSNKDIEQLRRILEKLELDTVTVGPNDFLLADYVEHVVKRARTEAKREVLMELRKVANQRAKEYGRYDGFEGYVEAAEFFTDQQLKKPEDSSE